MKGTLVTEKNLHDILGRLDRFADHSLHTMYYHLDGGMKKRIKSKYKKDDGTVSDTKCTVRIYPKIVKPHPAFNMDRIVIDVQNPATDHIGSFNISPGDQIWFLGNRIVVKIPIVPSNYTLYVCFQIKK